MTKETDDQQTDKEPQSLSQWQIMKSIFAAAFGVQSSKNRERDFSQGKPITFIIAGIIFTLSFILIISSIAKLVLSQVMK